jgi:hypothetical protein
MKSLVEHPKSIKSKEDSSSSLFDSVKRFFSPDSQLLVESRASRARVEELIVRVDERFEKNKPFYEKIERKLAESPDESGCKLK